MILINTTFCVEPSVSDAWRNWIFDTYIPSAESAGYGFRNPLVLRILAQNDGAESFAVQLQACDLVAAQMWIDREQQRLLADAYSAWGDKVLSFTTLMEGVQ